MSVMLIENKKAPLQHSFALGTGQKYRIEVANTWSKREEAYQLVYKRYRKAKVDFGDSDFDDSDLSEMWYSLFHAHPDTCTVTVKNVEKDEIVGSLTIVINSELGLPMEESYPRQLNELRSNHKKCAESISLGVHDDDAGDREVLIHLIKFSYLYAREVKGMKDYMIMVCPRQASFFDFFLISSHR